MDASSQWRSARINLGPVCFLLYVNDLPEVVKSNSKLFADDTKLYKEILIPRDSVELQQDLNSLIAWSHNWLLKLNSDKCVVLKIGGQNNNKYYLEGHELNEVSEQRELGVLISNDLHPFKHTTDIVNKANIKIGMIKIITQN